MRRLIVLVVVLVALAVARPAGAVPGDAHAVPGLPYLRSIDLAPGGAIWATAPRAGRLVRITPGPTVQVEGFAVPTRLDGPQGVAVADDGSVWFTTGPSSTEDLGRVDPGTGDVTTFAIPGGRLFGELVVAGDGRLWAAASHNQLAAVDVADGAVDPMTDVTFVDLPRVSTAADLDVAPDGSVWFGATSGSQAAYVGHVDGTDVEVHNAGSFSGALTVAPGGNVWFTVGRDVVRLDPRSGDKRTFTGADANLTGGPVDFGPDGELWRLDRTISRTDPARGDVDHYPTPGRAGTALVAGANRLWAVVNGKLIRIQPGAPGETDHRDPAVTLRSPIQDRHYRVDLGVVVDFSCRAPRGGRVVDCFGARAPTITPEVRDGSTLGFSSGIGRYLFGAYARDQAGNTADVDVVFFADPVCFDRQATLVDGDYGTPATEGDDVFVVAFRGGQGEVHGLGGDDRLCAAGVIDGGPGYDRCQGPASVDNTFRNCEVVVER